jgi:hypothetical protein
MSIANSAEGPATGHASVDSGQVIATYPAYAEAQRAVDHLSDSSFPVENAAIIGRDLSLVRAIVAARYELTVGDAYAERARQLLSSLG